MHRRLYSKLQKLAHGTRSRASARLGFLGPFHEGWWSLTPRERGPARSPAPAPSHRAAASRRRWPPRSASSTTRPKTSAPGWSGPRRPRAGACRRPRASPAPRLRPCRWGEASPRERAPWEQRGTASSSLFFFGRLHRFDESADRDNEDAVRTCGSVKYSFFRL